MKYGKTEKCPLVSIITPSYEQGRFIEDNILSVKNQDYPNIEHIIIDGGSCDNTLEVVGRYKDAYKMTFVSEKDEGQADAINKGFLLARGEIIGWINSDDTYLTKDAVRMAVEKFMREPGTYAVYGDRAVIDKDSNLVKLKYSVPFDYDKYRKSHVNLFQETVFLRSCIIKKHLLDKNMEFALDTEYFLRISRDHRFEYLRGLFGCFRMSESNKTSTLMFSDEWNRERETLRRRYGYMDRKIAGKFWSQAKKKLSSLFAGSYNNYGYLPFDIIRFGFAAKDSFAFPVKIRKSAFFSYFIRSLRPGEEP